LSALGGTRIVYGALVHGDIDVYAEYTGTLTAEVFAGTPEGALPAALAQGGVRMSPPLGFEDSYAIGMREDVAARLGIRTLSDLARHPELPLGFSNEFMDRGDGWPSLARGYGMHSTDVRGLDHELAYRGLEQGSLAATDLYTTDPEIIRGHLRVLEDDLHHFPRYEAIFLYRSDLASRLPALERVLATLAGRISQSQMARLNAAVTIDRRSERQVASEFAANELGTGATMPAAPAERRLARVLRHGREHLLLVAISLTMAILCAVPLGIVAAASPLAARVILAAVGFLQTLPSLALLVFMIPLLGIGTAPALVALFLYSLLPIVRNTYAGLLAVPPALGEAARALGLPSRARLRLIELPMASREILAGIKTAAVINVGTATLGALIGAGGYGQPIFAGVRLNNMALILEGAIPAALLALAVQGAFDLAERVFVPRGLRVERDVLGRS
jgi:osmoprotectant transport system permease protein